MKIVLLLIAIGVANAGKCGLKYQTITAKPCSYYMSMTGINRRSTLNLNEFKALNPEINCDQNVPANIQICLRSKRPCEVTTISADSRPCKDYLEMTEINGRKAFTKEQFMKKNPGITCNNPDTDIIPDGKEICLRLQNPCGKKILATGSKSCRHYIDMTGLNGDEPLTQAEFRKLNPTISCNNKNDIIPDGKELCVHKNRLCHMTVQAVGNKLCKDYIAMTTINGKDQLSVEQFQMLNPTIDCDEPDTDIIPDGKDVCLRLQRPCGLTIQAETGKTCNDYIEMSAGADGKRQKLTEKEFAKLNPTINCSIPISDRMKVCLYTKSQFDNPEVQDGTTYEAFLAVAKPMTTGKTRSKYTFDKVLFETLQSLFTQMGDRRRKRQATGDLDMKVAAELANSDPKTVNSIKSVVEKSENFQALDAEYKTWRPQMCKEMKGDNEYKKCVCDESKPYIHCQAVLTNEKEKIDKHAKREASQIVRQLRHTSPNMARYSRDAKKSPISQFIDFLTNRAGCADAENCLSKTCFSTSATGVECWPLPGPAAVLSVCASGEACIPSLLDMATRYKGGSIPISLFTETKLALKFGLCITEFPGLNVLSWLGLEKCLASIMFEYYLFKSQLDVTGQIALVVIKAALTARVQLPRWASKGFGGVPFSENKEGDVCGHEKHKCQDYCAVTPGDFGIGYKLEWWFFKWRPWKEGSLKDAVLSGC